MGVANCHLSHISCANIMTKSTVNLKIKKKLKKNDRDSHCFVCVCVLGGGGEKRFFNLSQLNVLSQSMHC